MEKYSHDAFDISGYIVRVPSLGSERNIVLAAWEKFQSEKIGDLITDKAHESLQAVYFNYTNPGEKNMGYDMLIGYMTAE